MAHLDPRRLKREAIVPLPASRRLSYVLAVSVTLVGMTAALDAFLWGVLNRPLIERREAVREFELSELRADYAEAVDTARSLQARVDTLSSTLATCESSRTDTPPVFVTPCQPSEVTLHVDGVQTLCMPSSELGKLEPVLLLANQRPASQDVRTVMGTQP